MSAPLTADEVIAALRLRPHPEGGYYRETFRDAPGHKGRAHSTAILFLLKAGEVSRWHRVDAAELWHWYGGAPLLLEVKDGEAGGGPGACVAERAQLRRLDASRLHRGARLRLRRLRACP